MDQFHGRRAELTKLNSVRVVVTFSEPPLQLGGERHIAPLRRLPPKRIAHIVRTRRQHGKARHTMLFAQFTNDRADERWMKLLSTQIRHASASVHKFKAWRPPNEPDALNDITQPVINKSVSRRQNNTVAPSLF